MTKQKHKRRSIRMKNCDYSSPGAYFITICTKDRQCLFGKIENDKMILNELGEIVENCWQEIPLHYPNVSLDEYIIMPNHIHGIIVINDNNVGAYNHTPLHYTPQQFRSPSRTIGSIIRGFKIGVTKWFRQNIGIIPLWQRNYYEHIIRNGDELHKIRQYIRNNPVNWQFDNENIENEKET